MTVRKNSIKSQRGALQPNYFLFSAQYLVLTSITYTTLLLCPWLAVKKEWVNLSLSLFVLLVCFRLLYFILVRFFTATHKSSQYALLMTVATVFPPIIGPIIVMVRSLESPS